MKKPLILIPILALLLAACTPDIVRQGGVVVRASDAPSISADDLSDTEPAVSEDSIPSRGGASSEEDQSSYDEQNIVYATKTGKKYHKDGCGHLSKSKIPMSLSQAQQQNLTPCSVCYPAI